MMGFRAVDKKRTIVSWSNGNDSAWLLYVLRQLAEQTLFGLLTTFNQQFDRVAMHGVRRELVEAQADAIGLPLIPVASFTRFVIVSQSIPGISRRRSATLTKATDSFFGIFSSRRLPVGACGVTRTSVGQFTRRESPASLIPRSLMRE